MKFSVQVPESNVLGEVGKGYKYSIELLNEGRIGISAQVWVSVHGRKKGCLKYLL